MLNTNKLNRINWILISGLVASLHGAVTGAGSSPRGSQAGQLVSPRVSLGTPDDIAAQDSTASSSRNALTTIEPEVKQMNSYEPLASVEDFNTKLRSQVFSFLEWVYSTLIPLTPTAGNREAKLAVECALHQLQSSEIDKLTTENRNEFTVTFRNLTIQFRRDHNTFQSITISYLVDKTEKTEREKKITFTEQKNPINQLTKTQLEVQVRYTRPEYADRTAMYTVQLDQVTFFASSNNYAYSRTKKFQRGHSISIDAGYNDSSNTITILFGRTK